MKAITETGPGYQAITVQLDTHALSEYIADRLGHGKPSEALSEAVRQAVERFDLNAALEAHLTPALDRHIKREVTEAMKDPRVRAVIRENVWCALTQLGAREGAS